MFNQEQGGKAKHMEMIMYLYKEAMFSVVLGMILTIFLPKDCLTMTYNSPQNLSKHIMPKSGEKCKNMHFSA